MRMHVLTAALAFGMPVSAFATEAEINRPRHAVRAMPRGDC